jgi:hypothetical protein
MAKPKLSTSRKIARTGKEPAFLGPGVHAAMIELNLGACYQVRLLHGARTTAKLAFGVSPRLLEECLMTRRLVIVANDDSGPIVLGALQTEPSAGVREDTRALEVEARHIRLRAAETITLEAGPVSLSLDKSGAVHIEGERMVIDVGALLRVLSAKVELP